MVRCRALQLLAADSKILEAIGGVEYNASCWAARFVVQRLAAIAGSATRPTSSSSNSTTSPTLAPTPSGSCGAPFPGYGKTNELPTTSNLLTTD